MEQHGMLRPLEAAEPPTERCGIRCGLAALLTPRPPAVGCPERARDQPPSRSAGSVGASDRHGIETIASDRSHSRGKTNCRSLGATGISPHCAGKTI
jgi:hypothetical protein